MSALKLADKPCDGCSFVRCVHVVERNGACTWARFCDACELQALAIKTRRTADRLEARANALRAARSARGGAA